MPKGTMKNKSSKNKPRWFTVINIIAIASTVILLPLMILDASGLIDMPYYESYIAFGIALFLLDALLGILKLLYWPFRFEFTYTQFAVVLLLATGFLMYGLAFLDRISSEMPIYTGLAELAILIIIRQIINKRAMKKSEPMFPRL